MGDFLHTHQISQHQHHHIHTFIFILQLLSFTHSFPLNSILHFLLLFLLLSTGTKSSNFLQTWLDDDYTPFPRVLLIIIIIITTNKSTLYLLLYLLIVSYILKFTSGTSLWMLLRTVYINIYRKIILKCNYNSVCGGEAYFCVFEISIWPYIYFFIAAVIDQIITKLLLADKEKTKKNGPWTKQNNLTTTTTIF